MTFDEPGQVVVPRGMRDLLDDWIWSPDAARWDPDLATGIDSERSAQPITLGFNGSSGPDFACFTMTIDTRPYEAAMAAVAESISRMAESFHMAKLGALRVDVPCGSDD